MTSMPDLPAAEPDAPASPLPPAQAALVVAMLAIKALDHDAALALSEYTGQWFVSARIEVSDGVVLKSTCEHRDTPEWAVFAYLDALKNISLDEVIVAKPTGTRRHYRWNGAAFAEQYDTRHEASS